MALGLLEGAKAWGSGKDVRLVPLVVRPSISASRGGQPQSGASAMGNAHAP